MPAQRQPQRAVERSQGLVAREALTSRLTFMAVTHILRHQCPQPPPTTTTIGLQSRLVGLHTLVPTPTLTSLGPGILSLLFLSYACPCLCPSPAHTDTQPLSAEGMVCFSGTGTQAEDAPDRCG